MTHYDRRLYDDLTDDQYLDLLHERLMSRSYWRVWRLRWRQHRFLILRQHFGPVKSHLLALLAEVRDVAHRGTHQPSSRAKFTDRVPGARHDR